MFNKFNLKIIAFFSAIFFTVSLFSYTDTEASYNHRPRIIILSAEEAPHSAMLYSQLFRSIGLTSEIVSSKNFIASSLKRTDLVVIPYESAKNLSNNNLAELYDEVSKGLNILTEKRTLLAEKLGLQFTNQTMETKSIIDLKHPDVPIDWGTPISFDPLDSSNIISFCKSKENDISVLSGKAIEKGKILFLSVPLGNGSQSNYYRYPYLHETITEFFGIKPLVNRNRLSAYIDWGYHYADNPYKLAQKLRYNGIDEVHISAWYNLSNCGPFLKDFITACHANGILAYAWFELPMVSKDYWDLHPEWREKTAAGADAHIDWRYLMALEIPECMEEVKKHIADFMEKYDWDGIDLAELYLESPDGYEQQEEFTPMCDFVIKDFKAKYNISPTEIFTPDSENYYSKNDTALRQFLKYRVDLCTRLNADIIHFLKQLRNHTSGEQFDIYVTQIDSFNDEKAKDNIAVDSEEFVKMQNRMDFTLQLEDAFYLWNLGADRYKKIKNNYTNKINADRSITMDINVVERSDSPFATKKQTGLELLSLTSAASNVFDKVCLYAAHTPYEHDYRYIANSLANNVVIKNINDSTIGFTSSHDFIFETSTTTKSFYLDGNLWPFVGKDYVMIPKGDHILELRTEYIPIPFSIVSLNTDIQGFSLTDGKITFEYDSKRNVMIGLSKNVKHLLEDDTEISPKTWMSEDIFYKMLPAGKHKITLYDEDNKDSPDVIINNQLITFKEQPVNIEGRYLYPTRELLNVLGAKIEWNEEYHSVTGELNGYVFYCQEANVNARANGNDVCLDVPPTVVNGRLMLPLRFICESLNLNIVWDEQCQLIKIENKK